MKYNAPKKFPVAFHNRSNYDYHFIIKKLAAEFKKEFTFFGENTKKYITFTVPKKKKLQKFIKMEKTLEKIYVTYYNLLIAQDLWQVNNQIFLIIFQKDFIELNLNIYTMIKKCETVELNTKIVSAFLNTQILKII